MAASDIDPSEITIFHNPACMHSRGAMAILDERAVDHRVVEYLITPPTRETLEDIISKLDSPVTDLIRRTDQKFVDAGFDAGEYQTKEEVIDFLLAHPELMQRPIILNGDKAVIARPAELVDQVLPSA